jgi:hypothetical protein
MRPSTRWVLGTAVASLAWIGCSSGVNLISRRAYYDRYQDLPARGQAVADQDSALLRDILGQCDAADEAPYPTLQADVDAMQRQAASLAASRQDLVAFERGYDSFAAQQGTVSPDDGAAWDRYRSMNAHFEGIGEAMRQSLQALNQSHADFGAAMQDAGIVQMDSGDVRAELDGFGQDLGRTLSHMDWAMGDLHGRSHGWGDADGDGHDRWMAVRGLQHAMLDNHIFAQRASGAADQLRASLPDQGSIYFGPGLPGGGGLAVLRRNEDELHARAKDFEGRRMTVIGPDGDGQGGPAWQGQQGQGYRQDQGDQQGRGRQQWQGNQGYQQGQQSQAVSSQPGAAPASQGAPVADGRGHGNAAAPQSQPTAAAQAGTGKPAKGPGHGKGPVAVAKGPGKQAPGKARQDGKGGHAKGTTGTAAASGKDGLSDPGHVHGNGQDLR